MTQCASLQSGVGRVLGAPRPGSSIAVRFLNYNESHETTCPCGRASGFHPVSRPCVAPRTGPSPAGSSRGGSHAPTPEGVLSPTVALHRLTRKNGQPLGESSSNGDSSCSHTDFLFLALAASLCQAACGELSRRHSVLKTTMRGAYYRPHCAIAVPEVPGSALARVMEQGSSPSSLTSEPGLLALLSNATSPARASTQSGKGDRGHRSSAAGAPST